MLLCNAYGREAAFSSRQKYSQFAAGVTGQSVENPSFPQNAVTFRGEVAFRRLYLMRTAMNIAMTWGTRPSASEVETLEEILRTDAELHPFFRPCHDGPVAYHLVRTGYLLDHVKGVVTCRCGTRIGRLSGSISGSPIFCWLSIPWTAYGWHTKGGLWCAAG